MRYTISFKPILALRIGKHLAMFGGNDRRQIVDMPLEQFAMIDNVPVGAIVVNVAFLNSAASGTSYMLPLKLGNAPLSSAAS